MGNDGSTLAVTDYTVNDENGGANYGHDRDGPGTINPATLTINAVTDTKTYVRHHYVRRAPEVVGLLAPTLHRRDQAFVSEDVMGTDASTLVVTGYTVNDGNGGSNYTVSTNDATGTITQLGITGSFTAANKFWDGTTAATVTSRSLHGVIGLDDVDLVGGTATFASSAIGTWSVTLTGASVTGADAGNYTLTSVSDANGQHPCGVPDRRLLPAGRHDADHEPHEDVERHQGRTDRAPQIPGVQRGNRRRDHLDGRTDRQDHEDPVLVGRAGSR